MVRFKYTGLFCFCSSRLLQTACEDTLDTVIENSISNLILIVDDDPMARDQLEAILSGKNCRVETASSGEEAIRKALAISPDVILLDLMIPDMDGFEICRRIRATPEISEVPIVIVTALDDMESFMQGLSAGADDFLTKPFNRHELRARISSITRLNRYRRLLQERARNRELTRQVINIQEEERRRIAQELHDEFGQALTTLGIGLKILLDELPEELQKQRSQIGEMLAVTRDFFTHLRHLASDLRPPALDAVGLTPALEGYCREFSRRTQLPIRFSAAGETPPLPDLYNITLYRFLQEALANVAKHARASQVWVRLDVQEGGVRLSIRDDGAGFAQTLSGPVTTPINRPDGSAGMGILGMQERLGLLNGRLEINARPGEGSQVIGWLPIAAEGRHD